MLTQGLERERCAHEQCGSTTKQELQDFILRIKFSRKDAVIWMANLASLLKKWLRKFKLLVLRETNAQEVISSFVPEQMREE